MFDFTGLSDAQILAAIFGATIVTFIIAAGISYYRERKAMTPAERKAHDEELDRDAREW